MCASRKKYATRSRLTDAREQQQSKSAPAVIAVLHCFADTALCSQLRPHSIMFTAVGRDIKVYSGILRWENS